MYGLYDTLNALYVIIFWMISPKSCLKGGPCVSPFERISHLAYRIVAEVLVEQRSDQVEVERL